MTDKRKRNLNDDDSSYDDDDHNTISPAPVRSRPRRVCAGVRHVVVALACRFALNVFTIFQQDHPTVAQDSTLSDLELELG